MTDASETQIQGALNFIEGQLGKPYRFHFSKSDDYNSVDWYCSELVWAAYLSVGIELDWDDNESGESPILPVELASYSGLTTILHYTDDEDVNRYKTTVTQNGATGHTYSCDGDTYTEAHEFEAYNYCYEKCRICDYVRQVQTHDYTYRYESINELTHYGYCECGAKKEFNHNFTVSGILDICVDCKLSKDHVHSYTYLSAMDGKMHRKMCSCGISQLELCLGITFPGSTTSCVKCGQVLNGGTVTPFGDNDEVVLFNKEGYLEETE